MVKKQSLKGVPPPQKKIKHHDAISFRGSQKKNSFRSSLKKIIRESIHPPALD